MRTGDITVSMGGGMYPQVIWNVKPNVEQLGAEWYVDMANPTLVLITNYRQTLYVRTAGRLLINVHKQHEGGTSNSVITGSAGLLAWGIDTDEQLDDAISHRRTKNAFTYAENPYFEVVRYNDNSVVFTNHNIMEAVEVAFDTITKGYAG